MNKLTDEMHHKQFFIIEDDAKGDHESHLTLYINTHNQIYLEVKDGGHPDDLYNMQFIVMNIEDAQALHDELGELIEALVTTREHAQREEVRQESGDWTQHMREALAPDLPAWAQNEKQKQRELFSA